MSASALDEPIASLDKNKPVALTKSVYTFNQLIKMYIGQMTGQVRKPYHGLSLRCRGDQCTYKIKTNEIIADGNCLFDSLLYILGREQSDSSRMALRRELYHHFIYNKGAHNHDYDLEAAKISKDSFASTHVLKSFTELYKRHIIVFELHNSGEFNAQIFINRLLPVHEVDFLILTQNPGHFTTFTKDREFVQSRAFLEKILDVDSPFFGPGVKLRDLIVPGETIPGFDDRNYTQILFGNYDQFMDTMTTDVPLPPGPLAYGYPDVPSGPSAPPLAPLLPLHVFSGIGSSLNGSAQRSVLDPGISLNNEEIYPTSAELRRMGTSSGSIGTRSPSLSPATKAQLATMNGMSTPESRRKSGSRGSSGSKRISGSRGSRGARSPSLSPATKAQIAAMNKKSGSSSVSTPRSVSGSTPKSVSSNLSPTTRDEIARMNQLANGGRSSRRSGSSGSKRRSRSRSGSLSPATKEALAIMNGKIGAPYTIKNAPNASPATKERIAQIALNEAANVSLDTMNQIARIGQGVGAANSPRGRRSSRTGANSPTPATPPDLRRTRRFRPSSIVGKNIARPFSRIFGKF